MAGFDDDPLAPGCYSQLLFSDEISGLETDFGFSSSFSSDDNSNSTTNAPKMLCFGDYAKQCNVKVTVENGKKTGQKPGSPACMDPSSLSVELTLHVANSNGADLWSSAGMVDSMSSG